MNPQKNSVTIKNKYGWAFIVLFYFTNSEHFLAVIAVLPKLYPVTTNSWLGGPFIFQINSSKMCFCNSQCQGYRKVEEKIYFWWLITSCSAFIYVPQYLLKDRYIVQYISICSNGIESDSLFFIISRQEWEMGQLRFWQEFIAEFVTALL